MSLPPGEFGGRHCVDLLAGQLDCTQHPWFQENLAGVAVSAHFFIDRHGQLTQLVDTDKRAWHAGQSTLNGRDNVNVFSIGIELEGSDHTPFAAAQYRALNELIEWLQSQYSIEHMVGHSEIAPGRKTDPGPFFDWSLVAEGGGE